MIAKYKQHFKDMYSYIGNRILAKATDEEIRRELFDSFSQQIKYYDVINDMLDEIALGVISAIRHTIEHRRIDGLG